MSSKEPFPFLAGNYLHMGIPSCWSNRTPANNPRSTNYHDVLQAFYGVKDHCGPSHPGRADNSVLESTEDVVVTGRV
jgi:hypothetical protein